MKRSIVSSVAALLVAVAIAFALPVSAFAGEHDLTAFGWNVEGGAQGDSAQDASLEIQAADMNAFGVDVSQWQGYINWSSVAKNVDFAIIRCGYGDNSANQDDQRWQANVAGCIDNGIPMGVYLYSYATNTSMAQSEALHVVRCLKEANLSPSSLALPIYLDIEDDDASDLSAMEFAAIFSTFKSVLAVAGYTNVGVYASASWWEYKLTSISLPAEQRWVAHWSDDLAKGYPKTKAAGCYVWQYSSSGRVSGIAGSVDVNWGSDNFSFGSKPYVYRLYNKYNGEHFYTMSLGERYYLISEGWTDEGIGWAAPSSSNTPIYRLYNPYAGEHHYTMSASERDHLAEAGWNYEGTGWYSDDAQGVPLYRQYNPNQYSCNHNYTANKDENDHLVSLGWKYEGIAWYGLDLSS